jgi:CheY-like chemotaxis protein
MNVTAKKRILVIDDDREVLDLFRKVFADDAECEVHFAADGLVALAWLEKEGEPSFDLIISEVALPGGFRAIDFAREARRRDRRAALILMADAPGASDAVRGQTDCDAYLEKPFTADELRQALRRASALGSSADTP